VTHHEHHHELPTAGRELTAVSISATLHCLTGCAIGEVLGMILGAAFGWSNLASIVVSVLLAFFFGYLLTIRPVLAAGVYDFLTGLRIVKRRAEWHGR